jgi:hypothetical protein
MGAGAGCCSDPGRRPPSAIRAISPPPMFPSSASCGRLTRGATPVPAGARKGQPGFSISPAISHRKIPGQPQPVLLERDEPSAGGYPCLRISGRWAGKIGLDVAMGVRSEAQRVRNERGWLPSPPPSARRTSSITRGRAGHALPPHSPEEPKNTSHLGAFAALHQRPARAWLVVSSGAIEERG